AIFNEEMSVPIVKQVVSQLASAIEHINLHGVAHRFVRPENVLWSTSNSMVKLTSFDMACLYWDTNHKCAFPSPKKGLPIEGIPVNLLDHLPPEAFVDNYDCSMVDAWSIGTLTCSLLTNENPFQVKMGPDSDLVGAKLNQWKQFDQKRIIPCEIRSLLEDIFVEADARMTIFDIIKDKRLNPELNSDAFIRSKPPAYYRIDVQKVKS